jgi:hypothetical protein
MKAIRVFGLAIGATWVLALIGPPAAIAGSTQICTNETGTCVEPMQIHWESVGHITLLSSIGNIECDVLMQTTVPLGLVTNGPVTVNPATLSYSNCLYTCTVTVLRQGTLSFLNEGNELGTVTSSGYEILHECHGIHCIYSLSGVKGHWLGPLRTGTGHDHVTYAEAEKPKIGGFFCPSVTKLDALFQDLSAIWLRS